MPGVSRGNLILLKAILGPSPQGAYNGAQGDPKSRASHQWSTGVRTRRLDRRKVLVSAGRVNRLGSNNGDEDRSGATRQCCEGGAAVHDEGRRGEGKDDRVRRGQAGRGQGRSCAAASGGRQEGKGDRARRHHFDSRGTMAAD